MRNIFGDQGNKERNFWEQGNSIKVNFGEHLNLFLRNKGTTVNFHREQGNMTPPPPPWEALKSKLTKSTYNLRNSFSKRTIDQKCTAEVCIFKNTVAKIKMGYHGNAVLNCFTGRRLECLRAFQMEVPLSP